MPQISVSHGGAADAATRSTPLYKVGSHMSKPRRLLSILLTIMSWTRAWGNVYTDTTWPMGPGPGRWEVGAPQHDVTIGFPDGFAGGPTGPDIHQDYWGQVGGGDIPAMGGFRPDADGVPAGVMVYHTRLWDGRRQGEDNPREEYLTILTVNITYLSPRVRKWLGDLPYDVIMVQEHHKHSKQSMGKIKGYSMVFSPAQVTHVQKRRKGKGNI